MAVICREHNLLFLANPLTASSCVAHILVDSGLGTRLPSEQERKNLGLKKAHHADVPFLIQEGLLKKHDIDGLFKFTGVRNPFDRVTSEYQKLCNVAASGEVPPWMARNPDKMARLAFVHRGNGFDSFVVEFLAKGRNWSPNARWVDQVDRFYRFENLDADVHGILLAAGVREPPRFPPFNVTPGKKHYRDYYSDVSQEIVARVFSPDLQRFGYEF
jgi:hypothetical protein